MPWDIKHLIKHSIAETQKKREQEEVSKDTRAVSFIQLKTKKGHQKVALQRITGPQTHQRAALWSSDSDASTLLP